MIVMVMIWMTKLMMIIINEIVVVAVLVDGEGASC